MFIDFEMKDDILIANISGDIDHHNAQTARGEIDGTFEVFSGKHLVMNFAKVSFVDSSGIGMVMGRYNKVKEKGGTMAICGCSEYMRTILFMSGIFTIVKECDDAEEAIALITILKEENNEDGTIDNTRNISEEEN